MGITYRIVERHQLCSTKKEWLKRLAALNEFAEDMLRQLRNLGCQDYYNLSSYDKDQNGKPVITQLRVWLNPSDPPFTYLPIAGNYVSQRTRESWLVTEDDVPNGTLEMLCFKLDYFGIRFLAPKGRLETFSKADWNFTSYEKEMSEWSETFYEGPDILDVGSTLFWTEIEDARKHVIPTVEMILRKYRIWLNAERMQEIKDAGKQFTA